MLCAVAPASAQKTEGSTPPANVAPATVLSTSVTAVNEVVPEKAYAQDRYSHTVTNSTSAPAVYLYSWGESAAFGTIMPVVLSSSTAGRFTDQVGWWLYLAPGQTKTVNFTVRSTGAERYCAVGEKKPKCGGVPQA